MHCTATNPVADTSAKSIKHRTARRSATMKRFPMSRLGNIRDPDVRPSLIRSRLLLNTYTQASGATNSAPNPPRLAAEEQRFPWAHGSLRNEGREPGHVDARTARRNQ